VNAPHPIFESFTRWDGDSPPGFQTNWIGAHSRTQYVNEHEETRSILSRAQG
jgi:hypothetical protein